MILLSENIHTAAMPFFGGAKKMLKIFTQKLCKMNKIFFFIYFKNHSVKIDGNPILFNCSQGFAQNCGLPKY